MFAASECHSGTKGHLNSQQTSAESNLDCVHLDLELMRELSCLYPKCMEIQTHPGDPPKPTAAPSLEEARTKAMENLKQAGLAGWDESPTGKCC